MAAPADVIAEMKTLGIGSDIDDEYGEYSDEKSSNGRDDTYAEMDKHRQTIVEISKMADKMSVLVQEIRNSSRETDDRLLQIETDLRILGLEE